MPARLAVTLIALACILTGPACRHTGPATTPPDAARPGPFEPDRKIWTLDPFRNPRTWRVESWANPATATVQDRTLVIRVQGGRLDKSAVSRPIMLDMSSRSQIRLSARNESEEPVRIAIAISTGPKNVYYESVPIPLEPGAETELAFSLVESNFKSAKSHWKQNGAIAGLDAVKRLFILVYSVRPGTITIDALSAIQN